MPGPRQRRAASPTPSWAVGDAPEPFTTWSTPGRSLDVALGDRAALPRRRDRRARRAHARRLHPPRRRRGRGHGARRLRAVHVGRRARSCCATARRRSCGRRPAWPSCPRARSSSTGPTPSPPAPRAAQGLPLIMSPAPHTYLDQKYDETTELGLTWAGAVEVRDAYEWDPARGHPRRRGARRRGRALDRDHRDARRRRLDGLPAPARGGRGRLVASAATGRTSARGWPPTGRCCASWA